METEAFMRVLMATVTAGAGHVQAAAALEEAWKAMRPRDVVERLDVLEFTPKLYRKMYVEGYVKLVEHAPELWALVFKKTDNPALVRKLTRVRRALAGATTRKFARHLREFAPDVVLCTHYLPLEILGRARAEAAAGAEAAANAKARAKWNGDRKAAGRTSTPPVRESVAGRSGMAGAGPAPFVASVVTDFEAHALWMEPGVDLYCVAQEQTRAGLIARGIAAEQVIATGIPIAARFSRPVDAGAVRMALGLRDDLPVLLVLSGGFGMGPVREILDALDRVKRRVQIVVVCGRNEDLRRDLAVRSPVHPTHVLGFVSNMQELMTVSALVLTKPGGLTSSEALALGRPLLLLNPIPGQEAANADYLLEQGAAVKVNRLEELPFRVEKLLATGKLEALASAASALGRPRAAECICREVLRRCSA